MSAWAALPLAIWWGVAIWLLAIILSKARGHDRGVVAWLCIFAAFWPAVLAVMIGVGVSEWNNARRKGDLWNGL